MMKPTQRPRQRRRAQVLVCTGCCCGHLEKGRAAVPVTWLQEQWTERGLGQTIGLSITDCLGPCDRGNVICLKQPTATTWISGLGEPVQYEVLLAWATASHAADRLIPLPGLLDHQCFDQPSDTDRAVGADDAGDGATWAFA